MKRESGANPGQSRCCEAPLSFRTSRPLIRKDREGLGTGVSQKTCQVDSTSKFPEGWEFEIGCFYCFLNSNPNRRKDRRAENGTKRPDLRIRSGTKTRFGMESLERSSFGCGTHRNGRPRITGSDHRNAPARHRDHGPGHPTPQSPRITPKGAAAKRPVAAVTSH